MLTGTAPTVTNMFLTSGCPQTGDPNTAASPVSPLCHYCPIDTKANLETAIGNWISSSDTTYGATINDWDVSRISDFYRLFWQKSTFNDAIGSWQTSQVTIMEQMFMGVSSFQCIISPCFHKFLVGCLLIIFLGSQMSSPTGNCI